MNGRRRLAVQLLIENRLQQRLKGRRRRIKPQRKRADPINQRAQFRVVCAQVCQRFGGIEGKFAAPAVVNHKATVYRARKAVLDSKRLTAPG